MKYQCSPRAGAGVEFLLAKRDNFPRGLSLEELLNA